MQQRWNNARRVISSLPGGTFWIDWYQRALDGRPQNWPLLRDVTLIDDAVWQQGGAPLDTEIRRLVALHEERRTDEALAATFNAEDVAWNPATGRLRLVPASALPEDVGTYARRKIDKAIAIFDDAPPQEYGALSDDLAMLRRALDDAGNLPVELFDACASALRRLRVRVAEGQCPPIDKDPLLIDYHHRLREVGADILAADPETQRALERRAAIMPNPALIEARDAIEEAVAQTAPLLEGHLANALPADAATATDPQADPENRNVASFRFAGRFLRMQRAVTVAKGIGAGFIAGNGVLIGTATYLQACEFLAKNSQARYVLEAIFRYLNLL